MAVSLVGAGCTLLPSSTPVAPSPQATEASVGVPAPADYKAVLDWRHATIELPLDHYGMSLREQQLVGVAASVLFARCVDPKHEVSDLAKTRARRYLDMEPDATHWLFGYWNAKYLAERGLDVNVVHAPTLIEADQATSLQCVGEPEYTEMESISADVQPRTSVSDGLSRWSAEAYQKAVEDARVVELVQRVNACINKAGLTLDQSSPLGGVAVNDEWVKQRVLKALGVEATCRDQVHFVQRAADIAAAYQAPLVLEHLDELNTMRAISTVRVAKAVDILREAGLI